MNKQLRILSEDILNRHFLGYDRVWNHFSNLQINAYPPHNVIEISEGEQLIELAVAGFNPEDVSITVEKGILSVAGAAGAEDKHYLHQGIAARSFVKQFYLNEYSEVKGAEFDNGILSITIKDEIPEIKKPKVIEIKRKD